MLGIDIDFIEVCPKCYEPLAVKETCYDKGQKYKATTLTKIVSEALKVPGFLIFYKNVGGTMQFRIKRVSEPVSEIYEMTSEQWLAYLYELHKEHRGGVANMQQKYEPHIRVKFSLFDSPQFRMIPNKHRAYCYLVFICLLKFANSKTLTCYPRQDTLSSMTGLSRSTIFRTTELLERSQIITKKRQKSTTLYTINKDLVVSVRNYDVSTGHMGSVYRTNISRTNITTNSNITNFIRGLAESGSDKETIS